MIRCPQCASQGCSPIACRFSGITHERAKAEDSLSRYVSAGIKRDQEQIHTGRTDQCSDCGQSPRGGMLRQGS